MTQHLPARFLFLVQRLCQQRDDLLLTQLPGNGNRRRIAGDLIMFHPQRRAHDRDVFERTLVVIVQLLFAFGDQALHGFAVLAGRLLVQPFEDPFQPLGVPLGLFQMAGKQVLQVFAGRSLGHLRQRFHQLVFRAIQVPQFID